jgi:hypothetical protein
MLLQKAMRIKGVLDISGTHDFDSLTRSMVLENI